MTDTPVQDQNAQQQTTQQTQPSDTAPVVSRPQQQAGRKIEAPSSVSGHRELAPIAVATDEDEPSAGASPPPPQIEVARPKEVPLSKELQEAGVEAGKDAKEIELDQELQDAGVAMAKESVPVSMQPPAIKLPMTEAEALETKKKSKMRDALKWIAALVAFQWKRHFTKLNPQEYK